MLSAVDSFIQKHKLANKGGTLNLLPRAWAVAGTPPLRPPPPPPAGPSLLIGLAAAYNLQGVATDSTGGGHDQGGYSNGPPSS